MGVKKLFVTVDKSNRLRAVWRFWYVKVKRDQGFFVVFPVKFGQEGFVTVDKSI